MRALKSLVVLVVLSFSLGSAGLASAEETARTYTPAQVSLIMSMRDNGDGLSDVAKVVGGIRAEVKAAEKAEKGRRRAVRDARPTETTAIAAN